MPPHLSRRGQKTLPHLRPILDHTEPPIYIPGTHTAPRSGDINLSTAENWLLRPRLIPKFLEYLKRDFDAGDLSYISGFGGARVLLEGLAKYFQTYFEPHREVLADHIVTAPGASHLLLSVMFHVCNEGEGVLIQTPYWPGFDSALILRDDLIPVHVNVPFTSDIDFYGREIIGYYEEALKNSENEVTAMIICNPHNPLGGIYPEETLNELLIFAQNNNLHVIVDELYAMSEFSDTGGPERRFRSVLSIDLDALGVDRWRVHVVYSFSKDLNSSGIRLGILVTQGNEELRNSVGASQESKLSSFTSVAATGLLQDEPFLEELLALNPEYLSANYELLKNFLDHHKISYVPPQAGVYLFANLLAAAAKKGKKRISFEEEEKLNKAFNDEGVRLNRGGNFHTAEPGWFRMVFAVPVEKLLEGLRRVEKAMGLKPWNHIHH